jgi:hypothetical protein
MDASMSKRNGLLLLLALAAVFLIVNRAAYKGYFTDDDFDHLSWTRHAPLIGFVESLLTPVYQSNNFRPVGHLFYHLEAHFFGFDFKKYLMATHLLHFLNVWLVWLLARRLGARPWGAAAGCALFALHLGYFEAVWKPAYIFDVLCATFCLLSLLCYVRGRWIVSFLCFWLAYKAKELAVMLPFVLACYELWFGRKRWKPLLPFFLASFSFALQALVLSPNTGDDNPYTFHFTLEALAVTGLFYAGRIFLVPYLGLAVPIAARFSGNRRIWFGVSTLLLFLFPVLFLPGRIETAYCYLPFTGLAIAMAGASELCHPAVIAAFFALFLPWQLHDLRIERRDTLTKADDARSWVTTWSNYAAGAGKVDTFLWSGAPWGFGSFGIEGAIKCLYPGDHFTIRHYDRPPVAAEPDRVTYLTWNEGLHKLDIVAHTPETRDASYIDANIATPIWQLGEGWSSPEGGFRWIEPQATARLNRPEGASGFELRVLANTTLLQGVGPVTVRVSLAGADLPPQRVAEPGWHVLSWDLPAAPAGETGVTIRTEPPFRTPGDPRALGIAVGSFGFKGK